jgi:Protoporphyrinogen oxidase
VKKSVVIIGAGPAGLTAAKELLKKDTSYDIVILEESSQIGGISRTVKHGENRMDIGGHRFFSKSREVMDWWQDVMPTQGSPSFDDALLGRQSPLAEGGPDPEKEDRVMLVRNRVSRIYYLEKFFDYPISMKWQTFKNMGFFRTMRAGFSYLWSAVVKKKEDSLENFYINRFGKVLYGMFFEKYTEKVWGRSPADISADWGAQRVKGLSIRAILRDMFKKLFGTKGKGEVETSLIEQFFYPKYGPGQLWETVAQDVEKDGAELLKNHRVTELVCKDGALTEVVCDAGGKKKIFKADVVISSMPLKDLALGITGDIPPAEALEVASGLPYRDFVTVGLLVNKLALKNETDIKTLGNIVPDCWIYVQDANVTLGRIQIFNNWSPYMVNDPVNTVWVGLEYFCNEGDSFWSMDYDECIKYATDELVRMGIIQSGDVLDSHRELVKKAYPAYFDTYDNIDVLTGYINTIDNLYCVGRNGQHRYNNMDHSMLTAIRAAECIDSGSTDKTPVWDINTEKDYHEKK